MPDLRHGRWQDVASDIECDACIFDAPFGEDTHSRYGNDGRELRSTGAKPQDPRYRHRPNYSPEIDYGFLTPADIREFVEHWHPRTRGWIASITDHNLAPIWAVELTRVGRLAFPPIPIIDVGSRARLCGDGPSCYSYQLVVAAPEEWIDNAWLVVARPRSSELQRWGTLPGHYMRKHGDPRSPRMGGKPLGVMREIVRDYAIPKLRDDGSKRLPDWPERPVVADPFAGLGTTMRAADLEGCNAVGAEVDEVAYLEALEYLGAPTRPDKTGTLALF
jgi:hypothetical protein